jgi:hypothetical protein
MTRQDEAVLCLQHSQLDPSTALLASSKKYMLRYTSQMPPHYYKITSVIPLTSTLPTVHLWFNSMSQNTRICTLHVCTEKFVQYLFCTCRPSRKYACTLHSTRVHTDLPDSCISRHATENTHITARYPMRLPLHIMYH